MLNPSAINPLTLPSVALADRHQLPNISAIYFALSNDNGVLYIGRSVNIAQRWLSHHRQQQLNQVGNVRLAWLEVSDAALLGGIELALIEYFQPQFNGLRKVKFSDYDSSLILPGTQLEWRLIAVMADREVDNHKLHELTGLHLGTIAKLRNNPPSRVDTDTLNKLCRALQCQPGIYCATPLTRS